MRREKVIDAAMQLHGGAVRSALVFIGVRCHCTDAYGYAWAIQAVDPYAMVEDASIRAASEQQLHTGTRLNRRRATTPCDPL
jgi:hypothetical protein